MAGLKTIEQQQYQRKIYSVSELNRRCKQTLESQFSIIWLEAEISNLAMPYSGHWYFSLKDVNCQVRCAMFKGKNRACKLPPEEGMKVLVRARVSLFEPRGEFQLIVEYLEPAGVGKLLIEFEQLKRKLESEGLFDPATKTPIKTSYASIAVITSSTGAAIHDVISVIRRRYPLQELVVYPCLVQGKLAAEQISRQIQLANKRQQADLILLVRGGGSMEDLWCFNDESLARVIHDSQLPIVTGIGHEVDFTIADYVADLRCATPTAAAEKVTRDQRELAEQIEALKYWQINHFETKLENLFQRLDNLQYQLRSPENLIKHRLQQLNLQKQQMVNHLTQYLNSLQEKLLVNQIKLAQLDPKAAIGTAQEKQQQLTKRLNLIIDQKIEIKASQFRELAIKLNSLSPLSILGRGYSITKTTDGTLLKASESINVGDSIISTLNSGTIESKITKIN